MTFDKVPNRLKRMLIPGKSFRLFYSEGNPNNCIYHVRAVVDHEKIVVRSWSPRRGWMYKIESIFYFSLAYNSKALFPTYKHRRKRVQELQLI